MTDIVMVRKNLPSYLKNPMYKLDREQNPKDEVHTSHCSAAWASKSSKLGSLTVILEGIGSLGKTPLQYPI